MIRNLLHNKLTRTCVLIVGFGVFAGATAANPPLGEVTYITEGLINTAIAYEIDRKCDSIDGRMTAGINFLWGLKTHAEGLGYTYSEIEAYVNNEEEKDRLELIARQRLSDMGAVEGDETSYCTVGRAEMAAGTPIGRLLR